MRFIGIFLLFFLLFPSFLNAASNYVQVTQTKNKKQLRIIKAKLKNMGLKMVYKKSGSRYLVYSGPYKSSKSSSYALKKIKRYFPYAKITNKKKKKLKPAKKEIPSKKNLIPAVEIEQSKDVGKPTNTKKISGFFTGISLGYSSAPTNSTVDADSTEPHIPNNKGISFNLEGGYHFENGFSSSLSYMKFNASDLVFDNVYGTINYRFRDFNDFVPYFGALVGYSSLVWNIDPVEEIVGDSDSESFFAGTQTGILYKGFDSFSLLLGYQCMFMGHITNIEDGDSSSKLQHETLHTIQMGIQYNF